MIFEVWVFFDFFAIPIVALLKEIFCFSYYSSLEVSHFELKHVET